MGGVSRVSGQSAFPVQKGDEATAKTYLKKAKKATCNLPEFLWGLGRGNYKSECKAKAMEVENAEIISAQIQLNNLNDASRAILDLEKATTELKANPTDPKAKAAYDAAKERHTKVFSYK